MLLKMREMGLFGSSDIFLTEVAGKVLVTVTIDGQSDTVDLTGITLGSRVDIGIEDVTLNGGGSFTLNGGGSLMGEAERANVSPEGLIGALTAMTEELTGGLTLTFGKLTTEDSHTLTLATDVPSSALTEDIMSALTLDTDVPSSALIEDIMGALTLTTDVPSNALTEDIMGALTFATDVPSSALIEDMIAFTLVIDVPSSALTEDIMGVPTLATDVPCSALTEDIIGALTLAIAMIEGFTDSHTEELTDAFILATEELIVVLTFATELTDALTLVAEELTVTLTVATEELTVVLTVATDKLTVALTLAIEEPTGTLSLPTADLTDDGGTGLSVKCLGSGEVFWLTEEFFFCKRYVCTPSPSLHISVLLASAWDLAAFIGCKADTAVFSAFDALAILADCLRVPAGILYLL